MTSLEILILIATFFTAITTIVITIRKISGIAKRIIHFLDDYFGEEERPGFPGRPGMQERLRILEMELQTVVYEMKPNSGSSIKDAINRIEKRLDQLEQRD